MGNVNCSAKMKRLGINIEPVLMLNLCNVSLPEELAQGTFIRMDELTILSVLLGCTLQRGTQNVFKTNERYSHYR